MKENDPEQELTGKEVAKKIAKEGKGRKKREKEKKKEQKKKEKRKENKKKRKGGGGGGGGGLEKGGKTALNDVVK